MDALKYIVNVMVILQALNSKRIGKFASYSEENLKERPVNVTKLLPNLCLR